MQRVNIYTKATVKGPRKRDGFFAYILEYQTAAGAATCGEFKHVEDITENRIELSALVEALKRLNRSCDLEIYTDSEHLSSGIEEGWLERWKAAGWTNAKGKEIANRDLWQKVDALLRGHLYTFHTKAHHAYAKNMEFELQRRQQNEKIGGKIYV